VRQIFFDPGSSFGGNMLVSTNTGQIFKIDSGGTVNLLTNIGEDTEGMDIATTAWGSFAGDLLVSSEGTGTVHLVTPGGAVTAVPLSLPGAETVSFVPLNLDATDPLQGFYVANYPSNIQFAGASNFTGLLGDAIVTDEFGGSTMWDIHFDGTNFTKAQFTFTGNPISQFEDGIFVTRQREVLTGTPEPSSLILLGIALFGIAAVAQWRLSATSDQCVGRQ
jgi:PEP-CTERM motif